MNYFPLLVWGWAFIINNDFLPNQYLIYNLYIFNFTYNCSFSFYVFFQTGTALPTGGACEVCQDAIGCARQDGAPRPEAR